MIANPNARAHERFFRAAIAFAVTMLITGAAQAAGGGDADPVQEAIFQAVNLVILLGVLGYFARRPIGEFFSGRRDDIRKDLDEAANLLTEAEHRNADLQRRLVDLNSEVEGIREAATHRAEEEAERILADARASAARIRTDAQAAVDQELRRAQAELRKEAADLALEIAARKLTENVTDGDRDRLIDEFIMRVEPTASGEGAN